MVTRTDIVAEARTWIGTPRHPQGRLRGIGVDCIGVPLETAHALGLLPLDLVVEGYSQAPDGYSMIAWCDKHIAPRKPISKMQLGDVVIVALDKHPQHVGVVGNYPHGVGVFTIIHSWDDVTETRLLFGSTMRFVACYSFPGVD